MATTQCLRVQVNLHSTSGFQKDDVVNVWQMKCYDGPTDADWFSDTKASLHSFYSSAFGGFMGATMTGTAGIKVYDLNDPLIRVPIFEDTSIGSTIARETSSLPREVAICCSFAGDALSGVNYRHLRSRVYLGCWSAGIMQNDGTISSTVTGNIATAAHNLLTGLAAQTKPTLLVCRSVGHPSPESFTLGYDVTHGWVDNAWDTQRRRGEPASSRTTFTD